ncbi:MAG: iron-sulfur cluster-binding domain-containing protein, partial [Myxococcales bacterium]|nr:iron-sulfur cluster-binding domain-containing protein [Myxococcales bacterium]
GVRVRRNYSISSGSSAPGARRIEITVRRVPGGRVSTALHRLRRGASVGLDLPAGDFVLDPDSDRRLLVAGGSGITPIRAMLRDLAAASDREAATARDRAPASHSAPASAHVVVVHVARSAHDAIFAAELASLATRLPWLHVHAWRDDRGGRLDTAALHALVPDLADRETFVCGPPGLIDLVSTAASSVGAGHRVHHERFVVTAPATTIAAATIQLLRSDTTVVADGAGSLLVQLERAGQRPAHGCRMGICNTCRCRKRTGTVEDLTTGAVSSEPDQDIRLCVSVARSDLALDL